MSPTVSWKAGAYAALMRNARLWSDETLDDTPLSEQEWYAGFDAARGRLADLEAELIRGEKPK